MIRYYIEKDEFVGQCEYLDTEVRGKTLAAVRSRMGRMLGVATSELAEEFLGAQGGRRR